jgi:HEAT repeat protein
MKNRMLSILTALGTLLAVPLCADEYQELLDYDWSASRQPLVAIENNLRQADTPEKMAVVEERMIAVLASEQAKPAARQFAARMLRRIAGTKSVPALAELLDDAELAHIARFALQYNPAPAVDAALRAALPGLEGDLLIGVLGTASLRGAEDLVPVLTELAEGEDATLAAVAVRALGNIADETAAVALIQLELGSDLAALRTDGLLKCADGMLAEGESGSAAKIYKAVLESTASEPLKAAALRGVLHAQPGGQGVEGLVAALVGDSPYLRAAAKHYLIEADGAEIGAGISAALASVDSEQKLGLLEIIEARGDAVALGQIAKLLRDEDAAVQVAAVATLGRIGDVSTVPVLLEVAAGEGELADKAYESLKIIPGDGVGEELVARIERAAGEKKLLILKLMADRAEQSFAPAILSAAADDDAAVRMSAIRALSVVGDVSNLPAMVALLLASDDAAEQNALMRALVLTGLRSADATARVEPIAAALADADKGERVLLVTALGRLRGERALAAVLEQSRSDDADIVAAAVVELAKWDTPGAAERLQEIAGGDYAERLRTVALRGYINAANMTSAQGSDETAVEMYERALELADSDTGKKAVLAGLSQAASPGGFDLVTVLLDDENLRAEAEIAMLGIAEKSYAAIPDKICEELPRLRESIGDETLKARIDAVLSQAQGERGYIREWLLSGPYTGGDLFNSAYAPEQEGADVKWSTLKNAARSKSVDLLAGIGGVNRVAYARAFVWSPSEQAVRLLVGSDDGVKVWVNGTLVHALNAQRALTLDQDRAEAELQQGWNELMLKIVQSAGDWGFAVKIVDADGKPLPNLKFATETE